MNTEDYVAAGYFVSRLTDRRDCTGIELRRVTLASDHSQRCFFPDPWALSWCNTSREDQLAEASVFGITDQQLDEVISWADASFGSEFGAWSLFFTLEAARAAARRMLGNAPDLDIWGVGLHRTLLSSYCEESKPEPPAPGYAPMGAGSTYTGICLRSLPFAEGGEVLGHEILVDGSTWLDSPESQHLDEHAIFRAVGVVPNGDGLIDSFDDALACCDELDSRAPDTQHAITGWLPWLVVRYPWP